MTSINETNDAERHQEHTATATTSQPVLQAWPKQLNDVSLSRASSNSSSLGASPARPPKSDRRRSSASPESVLQYTLSASSSGSSPPPVPSSPASASTNRGRDSPSYQHPATRFSILSTLSMATSPPALSSIRAGSTPVTPNTTSFQEGGPSTSSSSSNLFNSAQNGELTSPPLQRDTSTTSTAELLANTLDSYHTNLSREVSSASSSRYSSSVPPSRTMSPVPAPIASFTAGMDHQLSPTLGPLRIESTTGSKATVIRPDKNKRKVTKSKSGVLNTSSGRPGFQGGISSEDVFGGNAADGNDDLALSDVPSHTSSRRSRTFSISSSSRGKKPEPQGISSDDVFGRRSPPTSPKLPSLANMLSGLRRQTSRPDSRASSRGAEDHSSRASSSRHSQSNASMSEHESILSDRSRHSSSGKRRHRFSDVLKRKTDAQRAEEEEHLRMLADLRLKALALASAPDTEHQSSSSTSSSSPALGSRGNERTNAELLIRDMGKHRISKAESSSSIYSNRSAAGQNNDDTITSPHLAARSRTSSHSSFENGRVEGLDRASSSDAAVFLLTDSDRPSADVPMDADGSDDDVRDARKSFAATGRRATLMPTSSHSSLSDSEEHTMPFNPFLQIKGGHLGVQHDEDGNDRRFSQTTIAGDRRRSTLTPAHTMPSDHSKSHKSHHKRPSRDFGPATGTEADIEDQENLLTSSILDRRRSTIKLGQQGQSQESASALKKSRSKSSLKGSSDSRSGSDHASSSSYTNRPERTSAIIIPQHPNPARPKMESLPSSHSVRSITAEALLPPVRSSSRPDSPPSNNGVPLEQRSASMQSLSQRLGDSRSVSSSGDNTSPFNVPSTLTMSSRHAREAASVSAGRRISEPGSPTSSPRKLPDDNNEKLTEDIMAAMQPPSATASPRRSSAEQVSRGSAPRPDLGYHRRSSSDMLALMGQQRQRPPPGHHRRSSSSIDAGQKALPSKPAFMAQQNTRSPSVVKMQAQQYAKVVALLTRDKPLPAAAVIREEIKTCRGAGERAVLYARKINELATVESGLSYWLSRTQPSAPDVNDPQWARRRSSAATMQSMHHFTPHHHALREDNYSEAAFPIRRGSHDVYKARDITQRTPSLAPSTMVPNNIPYPGVYEDSQTLRTNSAMSNNQPSSFRSHSQSFASAALTATGLPKVGFFGGLGRKSSKRAPSSRHKASDGAAGLSISGPIRAPSPESFASTGTRSVSLRPSGPRPSLSASSSDRDLPTMQHYGTLPSSSSLRSLASIPQGSVMTSQTLSQASSRPAGSPLAYNTPPNNEEALTAMADVLPDASKDVLLKYLTACNGDHLAAIGAYFDDQRRTDY